MTSILTIQPLRFEPSFEQIPEDEDETRQGLIEALRQVSETVADDSGHAERAVHAKSHGLVRGELRVLDALPPELAQGVFAHAGTYPVVMRFSTNPGDILDDSVSTPRGLAIKIVGVEGERLPGSEADATQDFVMQNAPAFGAPTPKKFLGMLQMLAKTTDKAPGLKKALSAVLRGTESVVEKLGGQSPTLKSLGGHPKTHILGETFYTGAPFLYGAYYAKLSVAPVQELSSLVGAPVDMDGKPNALREAVTDYFASRAGVWEVRVQLATNLDQMPIEDASAVWPEVESPYVTVARIEVPAQPGWTDERAAAVDEGLAFSPWHGLAAHRPLGGVMRVRKAAYESSIEFRGKRNGCPIHEPRSLDGFPD